MAYTWFRLQHRRWCPFEFNYVSFGIRDVDRWTFSFGSIARSHCAWQNTPDSEEIADSLPIEMLKPQAEVVQVPPLFARCSTAFGTQLALDGYHVDKGASCSQLNEAEFVLAPFDNTTKNAAVELEHLRYIANAKDEVVDFADFNHIGLC